MKELPVVGERAGSGVKNWKRGKELEDGVRAGNGGKGPVVGERTGSGGKNWLCRQKCKIVWEAEFVVGD